VSITLFRKDRDWTSKREIQLKENDFALLEDIQSTVVAVLKGILGIVSSIVSRRGRDVGMLLE